MNKQKLGLWLAGVALRVTRNPQLAKALSVLPAIREQRLLILTLPVNQQTSPLELPGTWAYWTSGESSLSQSR